MKFHFANPVTVIPRNGKWHIGTICKHNFQDLTTLLHNIPVPWDEYTFVNGYIIDYKYDEQRNEDSLH